MSPIEILTAGRARAQLTWDPDRIEDTRITGILRYVAWTDYAQGTSAWDGAFDTLYLALPQDWHDTDTDDDNGQDFFTDAAIDAWEQMPGRTMSDVMALFDIAIRALESRG